MCSIYIYKYEFQRELQHQTGARAHSHPVLDVFLGSTALPETVLEAAGESLHKPVNNKAEKGLSQLKTIRNQDKAFWGFQAHLTRGRYHHSSKILVIVEGIQQGERVKKKSFYAFYTPTHHISPQHTFEQSTSEISHETLQAVSLAEQHTVIAKRPTKAMGL